MTQSVYKNLILYCALAALATLALVTTGKAAEKLVLDQYLSQVRNRNDGVRASIEGSQGAELRADGEAGLIYTPTLDGGFQYTNDQKPSPFFPLRRTINRTFELGVSQETSFGLRARASYSLSNSELTPIRAPYFEGRPELELSQSLWRNGFGSETRARHTQIESAALAARYDQSFATKTALASAESTYWRLALARQNLAIQKDALSRAQKIESWNDRRVRLQLADRSELYQTQALVEQRKLGLQSAQDELRAASVQFNQARREDSASVSEELEELRPEMIDALAAPQRAELRDDVKAAQQRERFQSAAATLGSERGTPNLEVYAAVARNSFENTRADAFSESWDDDRPTTVVGIRFSAPLDPSAMSSVRKGYAKERAAAELSYRNAVFNQNQNWSDLTQKLHESKTRLKLARSVEQAQERKLAHERNRLTSGRTTTYQVLLFEQDYSQAQLVRIQAQADVLQIIALMKTYSAGSAGGNS